MPVVLYYFILFITSFVLTLIYAYCWHRHFDVYLTLIFTLIPLVNLGYTFRAAATNLEEAVVAQKFIYIGGCFLIYFITRLIFSLCNIRIAKSLRMLAFGVIFAIYMSVLTIGYASVFYTDVSFEIIRGHGVLLRSYGPCHTIFYGIVIICFISSFAVILYSFRMKKQVSRKILYLLFFPEYVAFMCYFGERWITSDFELMPAAYVFAQVMYLLIVRKICLYDVQDTVIDSIMESGDTGYVSVDFGNHYLGSSAYAKEVFPELNELTVDGPFGGNERIRDTLLKWLDEYRNDATKDTFFYRKQTDSSGAGTGMDSSGASVSDRSERNGKPDGERIYEISIQDLYDHHRRKGYQFVIFDDTTNQQYISLINHYNQDLEEEVRKKTENLVEMHNQLVLGMATMVESRDNSTGGHIRRTSEGVRILLAEMQKDEGLSLPPEFCANLIKAAPMHDLGKIAVDDAVLRKPGSFTEEELAAMRTHPEEGARIVHEILKDTDDEAFRHLAENVAHYHHERWDGLGYPAGLKGEEIPYEARIMAVADVYDALVSRRVYKEGMPFDQADRIIMDGMGTQFDPALEPYYVSARPKLEAYYSEVQRAE